MYDEGFEIKQSPFKKIDEFQEAKRDDRVLMSAGISPEDHEIIVKYIRQRGNDFGNAKFLKELMLNFINNVAFDRCCFNDIFVILLLPKTQDPDELEDKGKIVGAIQFQEETYQSRMLKDSFMVHNEHHKNSFNFIFNLRDFNEDNYNYYLPFYDLQERAFFCVDESIQHDFVMTKMRLSEVYFELDVDNCYFTVISLNNYLDMLKDGVYVSKDTSYYHEGALVLLDLENDLKLYLTMDWRFDRGEIELALELHDEETFDIRLHESYDKALIEEFENLTCSLSPEELLQEQKQAHLNLIKYNDLTIEEKLKENERSNQIIKEIDEKLEQLSKDNS